MSTILVPTVLTRPIAPVAPVEGTPCGYTDAAAQMTLAIIQGAFQRRKGLRVDYRLVRAASWKAAQIAALPEPTHNLPSGESPNETIKRFGFDIGLGAGNSVESLVYGTEKPDVILSWLLASVAHRDHICGEGWFAGQDRIGVGCCIAPGTKYFAYWTVLIAG